MAAVRLARGLVALSLVLFAAGIAGVVYYRWINPPASIDAAWREALLAFGSFLGLAVFFAILSIYAMLEVQVKGRA